MLTPVTSAINRKSKEMVGQAESTALPSGMFAVLLRCRLRFHFISLAFPPISLHFPHLRDEVGPLSILRDHALLEDALLRMFRIFDVSLLERFGLSREAGLFWEHSRRDPTAILSSSSADSFAKSAVRR